MTIDELTAERNVIEEKLKALKEAEEAQKRRVKMFGDFNERFLKCTNRILDANEFRKFIALVEARTGIKAIPVENAYDDWYISQHNDPVGHLIMKEYITELNNQIGSTIYNFTYGRYTFTLTYRPDISSIKYNYKRTAYELELLIDMPRTWKKKVGYFKKLNIKKVCNAFRKCMSKYDNEVRAKNDAIAACITIDETIKGHLVGIGATDIRIDKNLYKTSGRRGRMIYEENTNYRDVTYKDKKGFEHSYRAVHIDKNNKVVGNITLCQVLQ